MEKERGCGPRRQGGYDNKGKANNSFSDKSILNGQWDILKMLKYCVPFGVFDYKEDTRELEKVQKGAAIM